MTFAMGGVPHAGSQQMGDSDGQLMKGQCGGNPVIQPSMWQAGVNFTLNVVMLYYIVS